ncbi:MAG: NUDIX domain-containing protein [Acidimicrobiales bacterium]|jgi:8-oxo-dGTP pyrophosphatase MutT (NUDIX family)
MAETAHVFNNVVCGLLVRSGLVLLVHRNALRLWAPNCWDAPGGHLERGETDLEALARELNEELGISFSSADARLVGRLTGAEYDARVFALRRWSGEPANQAPHEHDDLAWFGEEQLGGLVLADLDLLEIAFAVLRDQ